VGGHLPPALAASAVHTVVDATSWLAAAVVVPEMLTPFVAGTVWTSESLFLMVALSVQIVASQARVSKVDRPNFLGLGRWMFATALAAIVTSQAHLGETVNWFLIGAGALFALLIRIGASEAILAIRRAAFRRASIKSQVIRRRMRVVTRATPPRQPAFRPQLAPRLTQSIGRPLEAARS
jgi:hypothetical protein